MAAATPTPLLAAAAGASVHDITLVGKYPF